ncbi:MAG TPA: S24 family peptidase [Abditibacteriaceae bacterium]|jgi:repressor LexA
MVSTVAPKCAGIDSLLAAPFGVQSAPFGVQSAHDGFSYIGQICDGPLDAAPLMLQSIGAVQAGFPSPAEEELSDNFSLESMLIHNRNATFLLNISGDSMIEAGLMPGDVALVDTSLKPVPGDVVVACVDGNWTMKYFRRDTRGIYLEPANPKYKPIRPREQLIIHSVVVSSLRTYR